MVTNEIYSEGENKRNRLKQLIMMNRWLVMSDPEQTDGQSHITETNVQVHVLKRSVCENDTGWTGGTVKIGQRSIDKRQM